MKKKESSLLIPFGEKTNGFEIDPDNTNSKKNANHSEKNEKKLKLIAKRKNGWNT